MTAISDVAIANRALQKLGAGSITSFTDGSTQAREVTICYEILRDAELRRRKWRFSLARVELPELADAPTFGYDAAFQLPGDCLKVISVGDYAPGLDLSELRASLDDADYAIEGRTILTNLGAPLRVRYVRRVEDPAQFDAAFVESFACRLAAEMAEALTQSNTKREAAWGEYRIAIREAVQAAAIESPPQSVSDDSWLISRAV